MELQGKIINFLGDSITEGCGTSDLATKPFPKLIEEKYCLSKANNYGIGGTRIARQSEASVIGNDLHYCGRVEEMDENADAVVVFGGTNDFGHGDAELGTFDDRTDDTFYGACHTLMVKLINRYPTKPIVFITPLHRDCEVNARGLTLEMYVDIIKEVAKYYSLPVLDFYAESGIQPCVPIIREKLCPDGLHPNDAGHVIMADKIAKYLLAL